LPHCIEALRRAKFKFPGRQVCMGWHYCRLVRGGGLPRFASIPYNAYVLEGIR
jgi:hypothetical protein